MQPQMKGSQGVALSRRPQCWAQARGGGDPPASVAPAPRRKRERVRGWRVPPEGWAGGQAQGGVGGMNRTHSQETTTLNLNWLPFKYHLRADFPASL